MTITSVEQPTSAVWPTFARPVAKSFLINWLKPIKSLLSGAVPVLR